MSGPTSPIRDAIRIYHAAALAVLNDPRVWHEERASKEARSLAWPRPYEGTQFNRLLSVLFNADVDVALVLLKARDDPGSPAWPPDVRDPKMQALLRVVQRAMEAGAAAIVGAFGGDELTRKRDYQNSVTEALAELGIAWGLTHAEAAAALGIEPRRAKRARKRMKTREG